MVRFISDEEVRAHLRLEALIPAVEQALIDFSAGRAVQPLRQLLRDERRDAFMGVMPAMGDAVGLKLFTFHASNSARGLPTHYSLIILCDTETGEPLAAVDGRLITEMRTAAVSAAATKLLAAPDAAVLTVLGSGVQARSHIEALTLVRPFTTVRVWSRTAVNAERLAKETRAEAVRSAEDAVRGADVIVTATPATLPILHGAWLKPGAHVNAIGWRGADSRELDDAAMQNTVVVESRDAALAECGDVRLSGATIQAELGDLLTGTAQIPARETTVFESVGMAVEDLAATRLVYEAVR